MSRRVDVHKKNGKIEEKDVRIDDYFAHTKLTGGKYSAIETECPTCRTHIPVNPPLLDHYVVGDLVPYEQQHQCRRCGLVYNSTTTHDGIRIWYARILGRFLKKDMPLILKQVEVS